MQIKTEEINALTNEIVELKVHKDGLQADIAKLKQE